MKNIFPLLVALTVGSTAVFGQIYIDTGNPDQPASTPTTPTTTAPATTSPQWETQFNTKPVTPTETKTTVQPAPAKTETVAPKAVEKNISTPASTVPAKTTTAPTKVTPAPTKSSTTPSNTVATTKPSNTNLMPAKDELPPNAKAGHCYARCYIPDQYTWVEQKVVDKPSSYKTQLIPAEYVTEYDTVLVTPERKVLRQVPAVYEVITEEIMVEPSRTEWIKKPGDANCLSNDPNDCQVLCLVEIPAKYKTQQRKVVTTPAYTEEVSVPAEYKVVSRQLLKAPQRTIQIEIPATYKTIMVKQLSQKGGYQEWREVLCDAKVTTDKIQRIQKALKERGYDPGPLDNVLGPQTKSALTKYQTDKGLPVGNLNIETLRSLGIDEN